MGYKNYTESHRIIGYKADHKKNMTMAFMTPGNTKEMAALIQLYNDEYQKFLKLRDYLMTKGQEYSHTQLSDNPFDNDNLMDKEKVLWNLLNQYIHFYADEHKASLEGKNVRPFINNLMKNYNLVNKSTLSKSDIMKIQRDVHNFVLGDIIKIPGHGTINKTYLAQIMRDMNPEFRKPELKKNKVKMRYFEVYGSDNFKSVYTYDHFINLDTLLYMFEHNDFDATKLKNADKPIYYAIWNLPTYPSSQNDLLKIQEFFKSKHRLPYKRVIGYKIYKNGNIELIFKSEKDAKEFIKFMNTLKQLSK